RGWARSRGIARGTAAKAVESGRVSRRADGKLDAAQADAQYVTNTGHRVDGRAGNGPAGQRVAGDRDMASYRRSRARREATRAAREAFALERELGAWVRRAEVARDWRAIAQRTRDAILLTPCRLSASLHGADARVIEATFMHALREALTSLADGKDVLKDVLEEAT
ncbi:MAG: hypothetical protein AAB290_02930, partial [Candidatus Eisenbacteria bacterium]